MPLHRSLHSVALTVMLMGSLVGATAATSRAASPAAVHRARVTILNFAFTPATLKIRAGTTVVWTNKDSVTHTVTATRGRWGSGDLNQGQTFTHTFEKAGTYTYHCAIHPSMVAKIIVTASSRPSVKQERYAP